MTRDLDQQVVVVVGASSGIGRASALRLAREGAKVVVAARSAPALRTLEEEIVRNGGEAMAVPTDVGVAEQVYALADASEARFGRIDTWVNAAAVSVYAKVEDTTDEEFATVMQTNFLGHVHGIHAALPALRRGGGGTVIGISSVEGERAMPLHGAYSASKRALRSLYDALRIELTEEGAPIAVTTILPASIDTPFFEHSRSKIGSMPKPPPPVYSAELVADAVAHAAVHPTRELPVGGAAAMFFLGQRLSPAITDAILSVRRIGFQSQSSDREDNGSDNLDAPMDDGRVGGSWPGRVVTSSPATTLVGYRERLGDRLTALISTRHRGDN